MAKERIVSPKPIQSETADAQSAAASPVRSADNGDKAANPALRPMQFDEYIGQARLIERLSISLDACRQRGESLEHVLLHGPPGLGKTTLAHIIAKHLGTQLTITSGPAITKPGDLVATLTKLQQGDVLFIDEIHRLSPVVEEYIYPAMEDFKIDITLDSGMHAKTITMPLKPFCLIGATTRAGLLSAPMRSRFGLAHSFEYYKQNELISILTRSGRLLNLIQDESLSAEETDAITAIAKRSRGTPRIANRLLRRVRDYCQVRGEGKLLATLVDEALKLEGVDELGLDELDHRYMKTIADIYEGGPVGLEAIAATLGEDSGTLEDVIEPYLLQIGFLARTRKGRQLTTNGAAHIGYDLKNDSRNNEVTDNPEEGLFNG